MHNKARWMGLLMAFLIAACGGKDSGSGSKAEAKAAQGTLNADSSLVEWLNHTGTTWAAVSGAQTLGAEDRVRTDQTGHAVLTFFTGTEVEILPGSELLVREFSQAGSESTITLDQVAGETVHRVRQASDTTYQVTTPVTHLAVRGTEFGVKVAASGATQVTVTSGVVSAQVGTQQFDIKAGESLVVSETGTTSGPLPAPTHTPAPTINPILPPPTQPSGR